jgi:hypothetical protein
MLRCGIVNDWNYGGGSSPASGPADLMEAQPEPRGPQRSGVSNPQEPWVWRTGCAGASSTSSGHKLEGIADPGKIHYGTIVSDGDKIGEIQSIRQCERAGCLRTAQPLKERRDPSPIPSSPGVIVAQSKDVIFGRPDNAKISTSHVERINLIIRMGVRRFTRLANGFSRKLENHSHALALYFFHYNFCRLHKSLKITPAMQAGVSDRRMDTSDLVQLKDKMEEPAKQHEPYKKRLPV